MVKPAQGDIYWVKFGRTDDSGPAGMRPAVVIQNDLLNKSNIQTTVVTLLTSNIKLAAVPGNLRLRKGTANLPKTSVVVVSQVATVDRSRLLGKIGTIKREQLEQILQSCQDVISLKLF
ncbi:MAG: type II toxin-antitoxin system PemK/MazF family toxin [Thermodesulfobacteriota bacterium]|nr:type II toxin-antitoxin system PemK/MazF family toxin [Thermodesulfobacteriota bacterium]